MSVTTEKVVLDGKAAHVVTPVPDYVYVPPAAAAYGSEEFYENDYMEKLSGFIFMCNQKTKPECYQYRVFGLPKGKLYIAKKIKPGMKLFLFDFETKHLYGIYEATSGGELNLEPSAFGGKFPAQVGFKIYKDCYPLPEYSFKPAIQDNYYNGFKFNQELSTQQVKNLLSLFCSITAPPLEYVAPRLPSVSPAWAMQLLGVGNQFQAQSGVPYSDDPYIAGRQLSHASLILEPQHNQQGAPQNYCYEWSSYMAHVVPAHEMQPMPPALPQSVARWVPPVQHAYHGLMPDANPATDPQAVRNPAEQHSAGIQQPYLAEPEDQLPPVQLPCHKYVSILSDIRRYGAAQDMDPSEYYPAVAQDMDPGELYPSTLQGERKIVQQQDNAVE